MEASGGYERLPHQELVAQGVITAIVNPERVRDFARSLGFEAKTDRVDAKVIARYGKISDPRAPPVLPPAKAYPVESGSSTSCGWVRWALARAGGGPCGGCPF